MMVELSGMRAQRPPMVPSGVQLQSRGKGDLIAQKAESKTVLLQKTLMNLYFLYQWKTFYLKIQLNSIPTRLHT